MTNIKFANGKSIEAIPFGGKSLFQGVERNTLEFKIAEETITYDELLTLYKDASALSEIEVVETQDDQIIARSVHLNYNIPMELALSDYNEDKRIWRMKIAQKSLLELEQEKQAVDINDTQLALIELANLIGGDNNG